MLDTVVSKQYHHAYFKLAEESVIVEENFSKLELISTPNFIEIRPLVLEFNRLGRRMDCYDQLIMWNEALRPVQATD